MTKSNTKERLNTGGIPYDIIQQSATLEPYLV